MGHQIVVQLIALTELEDQPDRLLGNDDLIQASNVRVNELSVMVDLAGEVWVVARGSLEDDLGVGEEGVSGQVDSAERACADNATEGVVAYVLEM